MKNNFSSVTGGHMVALIRKCLTDLDVQKVEKESFWPKVNLLYCNVWHQEV